MYDGQVPFMEEVMSILAGINPITAALNLATALVKSRGLNKANAAQAALSPNQKAGAFARALRRSRSA